MLRTPTINLSLGLNPGAITSVTNCLQECLEFKVFFKVLKFFFSLSGQNRVVTPWLTALLGRFVACWWTRLSMTPGWLRRPEITRFSVWPQTMLRVNNKALGLLLSVLLINRHIFWHFFHNGTGCLFFFFFCMFCMTAFRFPRRFTCTPWAFKMSFRNAAASGDQGCACGGSGQRRCTCKSAWGKKKNQSVCLS